MRYVEMLTASKGKASLFIVAATVILTAGCTEENDAGGDGDTAAAAGTVALDTNPAAISYPDGLSVSALAATDDPTADAATTAGTIAITYDDASSALASASLVDPQLPPPPGPDGGQQTQEGAQCFETYEQALEQRGADQRGRIEAGKLPGVRSTEGRERVNGKASDCVSEDLVQTLATLRSLIREGSQGLDGYGDCFLPDWGIVEGFYNGTQDVCTVGYVRAELRKFNTYVDFTKSLSEAMLCQAFKDRVITEEIVTGESLDLTPSLQKALLRDGALLAPIKTAKITRATGTTVEYLTEFVMNPNVELMGQAREIEIKFAVTHRPADAANESYTGVVRVSHPSRSPNMPSGTYALSLDYSRSADASGSRLKYELRSGMFAAGTDPFGADGVVNYNVFGTDTAEGGTEPIGNDKLARMNYVSYDGYPELDVAKVSYWVNFGGSYTERARGMVFDVKRVNGEIKGCAVAGALGQDLSIRSSLEGGFAMLPTGYMRPFLCNQAERGGPEMWLQCFYRDESGNFVPDSSLIENTTAGYDFVPRKIVEDKAPQLTQVPRPPTYVRDRFAPPPGAPGAPQ